MYSVKKGFTLIEITISTILFAIIIIVVYSSFNLGLRIWRRETSDNPILQPIRVGLLKIEKELKSAFFYTGIPFKGTKEHIIFPLIISKEGTPKIRTVHYYIEKDKDLNTVKILRKVIEAGPQSKEPENVKTVFEGLDSASFNYAFKSIKPLETFVWKEDFDGTRLQRLPNGVRVSLILKKESFDKIIFIPQGELLSE